MNIFVISDSHRWMYCAVELRIHNWPYAFPLTFHPHSQLIVVLFGYHFIWLLQTWMTVKCSTVELETEVFYIKFKGNINYKKNKTNIICILLYYKSNQRYKVDHGNKKKLQTQSTQNSKATKKNNQHRIYIL